MDGQLDFLGLLSEYTDDQGAKVKVREPGVKRNRPIPPKDFEQVSFDFSEKDAEFSLSLKEAKPIEKNEPRVEIKTIEKPAQKVEEKIEPKAEEKPIEKPAPKVEEKPEPKAEVKPVEKPAPKTEPKPEPKRPFKSLLKNKTTSASEFLFEACAKCWCSDCRHNSRNEGVPRDLCGVMMACPACQDCIDENMPTVCEIGNAKGGCKTRAAEEGITE